MRTYRSAATGITLALFPRSALTNQRPGARKRDVPAQAAIVPGAERFSYLALCVMRNGGTGGSLGIALLARLRIAFAASLALTLCVPLMSCGRHQTAQSTQVLRRGLGGDISTLDPQKAGDSFSEEVLRDLFEGLTSEMPDGTAVPALAKSWEVSADGRTYTFVLRHSAKWSNGDPVTAEDVVSGMRRALDPAVASPAAALLRPITHASEILAAAVRPETLGVEAIGPDTVVIHLENPTSYLPMLLARCVAFPVHTSSLQRYGDKFASAQYLVTNGPYRLESVSPNTKITLVRSDYYWDASRVAIGKVEHFVIADASAELLRYRGGGLDMTSTVPASRFEWARQELGPQLQVRSQLATIYLSFNLKTGALHDSPDLRRALSLAIDRSSLTERVLRAGQVPAYSFVPPGIDGYAPAEYAWRSDTWDGRIAVARRLLERAVRSGGQPQRLRVIYSENEAFRNTALTLAANWKDALGVDTQLEQLEFKTFLAQRAERGRWDVLISAWGGDYQDPSNFLEVFRSGVAGNDPGFEDSEFDRLLDRAASELSPSRRMTLLNSAERRLTDSYAIAPVYFPVIRRLVNPRVEGANLSAMNHNYSKHLRLRK